MSTMETQRYRHQSLSLNNLDTILRQRDINSPETRNPSSSSELSFDSNWFPAQPLEPPHPAPARVNTPPGLPSFGSKQATLLRLEQRRSSRSRSRIRSWLSSESTEHAVASGSASTMTSQPLPSPIFSPPLGPQSPPNGATDSRELLRRTLAAIGMSRVLDPDPVERPNTSPLPNTVSVPASSSTSNFQLPPGVYMTHTPGPLARAQDGTYMRGSFPPRASGHGIGARDIGDLPLARLAKRAPTPAQTPATLDSLRRTDAATGKRSTSAIGAAEVIRTESEKQAMSKCDVCCEKFCMYFCGVPAS